MEDKEIRDFLWELGKQKNIKEIEFRMVKKNGEVIAFKN